MDEKRMSSEEMVRQARERLSKRPEVRRVTIDDIETDEIDQEVAREMPIDRATAVPATRPSDRPTMPRPRRRQQAQQADPFSRQPRMRRESQPNQAVAAAIGLAVFILGLAVFLAFVSVSP